MGVSDTVLDALQALEGSVAKRHAPVGCATPNAEHDRPEERSARGLHANGVSGAFAPKRLPVGSHGRRASSFQSMAIGTAGAPTHLTFMQGTSFNSARVASLALALAGAAMAGCSTMFGGDAFELDSGYDDESTLSAERLSDRLADPAGGPDGVETGSGRTDPQANLGWPAELTSGTDRLVIYPPQVDGWDGNRIRARCAVAVTAPGATAPIYGVVSISARSEVDKNSRLVTLQDLRIASGSFGGSPGERDALNAVRESVSAWPRMISLDRLTTGLAIVRAEAGSRSPSLDHAPPQIIYSPTAAVLVLIDGSPALREVQDTGLQRVINTPALLLFDPATGTYYLDARRDWMRAASLDGPWTRASDPPAGLERVKAQLVQSEEPAPDEESDNARSRFTPTVYVRTTPAELIETSGPPQYESIPGTDLAYATNTHSDIFMDVDTRVVYVLLLGRWFTADSLEGPWRWLPARRLPHDFSRIDPDGPKGRVLVSIPGTDQAREALVADRIPQTASVSRAEAKLEVSYDGAPKFAPIEGTRMQYAVNADADVIGAAGRYYAVKDGVWFVCDSAFGPWALADAVPPEIYSIPPSSPLYHDRFVYVYGSTPDIVYTGYTPGYTGTFVDDNLLVYGTGWGYPSWCGSMYYGGPWTWGFGYEYNYWDGGWFYPHPGRWWYHDWPHLHRLYAEHWHPRGPHADPHWVRSNLDAYSRWHPRGAASPASASATLITATPGARGPASRLVANGLASNPDLYAGHDGSVYLHRRDGWYRHDRSNQWNHVGAVNSFLAGEHASRMLGSARWSQFHAGGHGSGMPLTLSSRVGTAHGGFGRGAMGHSGAAGIGMAHGSFSGGHH